VVSRESFLTLDPPEASQPQPVVEGMALRGKRVIVVQPEGYLRDVRAWGPAEMREGALRVPTVREWEWYAHGLRTAGIVGWTGQPDVRWVRADLVFVE
jgi:hypothetical protein